MKFRIVLSSSGGELDAVSGEGDEYEGAITQALREWLDAQILMPGDTITVHEVAE